MLHLVRCTALVAVLCVSQTFGQTVTTLNLGTQGRNADFSNYLFTRPVALGSVLPANCQVGQLFFNTAARTGQNLYACTQTNTWSALGGSNYILPVASSTTLGGVTVPASSGLLVSSGGLSVAFGTGPNTALQGSILGQANGVASLDATGKIPVAQLMNLGSAAFANSSAFDPAGAAATAVGAIPLSGPSQTQPALIRPADWASFNNKQSALGFTPENSANKNAKNGYAGLDAGAQLPWIQISGVPTASGSRAGILSPSDWNTFNLKQPPLGFTPENLANKGVSNGYASLNSSGQVPSTQLPLIPTKTSQLTNDAGFVNGTQAAAAAPVQSVNGQTGAVTVASRYQTVQNKGAVQTQRNALNLKAGPNVTLSFADNASNSSTDVSISAASGGTGAASPNVFYTDTYSGSIAGAVNAAIAAGGGNVYVVTPGAYTILSTLSLGSASTRVHLYLGQKVILDCYMTDHSNCITLYDGSGIHGIAGITTSPTSANRSNPYITLNTSAKVANVITNAVQDGSQQSMGLDGFEVINAGGATVDQALIHIRGLFSGTALRNITTANTGTNGAIGLLIDTPAGQQITPTAGGVTGTIGGTTVRVSVPAVSGPIPDSHNVWAGAKINVTGCSEPTYNGASLTVASILDNADFTYTTSAPIANTTSPAGCTYHQIVTAAQGGSGSNITSVIHIDNAVINMNGVTGSRPIVIASQNAGAVGDIWCHSCDPEGAASGGAEVELNGVGESDFYGMHIESKTLDTNNAAIAFKIVDCSNINLFGISAGGIGSNTGASLVDISQTRTNGTSNINVYGLSNQSWAYAINNHINGEVLTRAQVGQYHYSGKNWDGTPSGGTFGTTFGGQTTDPQPAFSGQLWYRSDSGQLKLQNGTLAQQILTSTGTPSNTDVAGQLVLSSGTASYSFTQSYRSAPVCTATDTTSVSAVRASVTTAALTLTGTGSDVINYICWPRN